MLAMLETGVGKSTLVKFIISALNLDLNDVCYITYTGRAALVLRDKGCPNAITAHKLLYKSYPRKDGTFYHLPRTSIDPYKIIIVDEVSMLPRPMWLLLLTHHIHVIALGDPGQLSPPASEDNGILAHPHIFLDEIMRQAKDSEIIRLTMDIREGKPLPLMSGEQVRILDRKDIVGGMYLWADQIIASKNETRKIINNCVRKCLYNVDSTKPVEGDKVVCLRNYWNKITENGNVLINGSIGYLSNIHYNYYDFYLGTKMSADFLLEEITEQDIKSSSMDLYFRDINMDYKLFSEGTPTINEISIKSIPKNLRPLTFDYGYCITCWKAQGGEYNKVLLIEEDFPYDYQEHIKYLYTGATRAKNKLIIIRK